MATYGLTHRKPKDYVSLTTEQFVSSQDIRAMKFFKFLTITFFLSVSSLVGFSQSSATKAQKEADKKQERLKQEEQKAQEAGKKRHLKLQDKETRKRMRQNRKKNKRNNRPKRWSVKKRNE